MLLVESLGSMEPRLKDTGIHKSEAQRTSLRCSQTTVTQNWISAYKTVDSLDIYICVT